MVIKSSHHPPGQIIWHIYFNHQETSEELLKTLKQTVVLKQQQVHVKSVTANQTFGTNRFYNFPEGFWENIALSNMHQKAVNI